MCSEDLHWVKDASKRKIVLILSFSDFEQYEFVFCWKNSDIIVKIAYYMSRGKFSVFSRKVCACLRFWFLIRNCWNFYRKTSERFLKIAFCVSRTTTRGLWFFEHFVFSFSHFRTSIKKALDGFAISLGGLLKLQLTCPEEKFKGKMVHLRKKIYKFFCHETVVQRKCFGPLARTNPTALSKFHCM